MEVGRKGKKRTEKEEKEEQSKGKVRNRFEMHEGRREREGTNDWLRGNRREKERVKGREGRRDRRGV